MQVEFGPNYPNSSGSGLGPNYFVIPISKIRKIIENDNVQIHCLILGIINRSSGLTRNVN